MIQAILLYSALFIVGIYYMIIAGSRVVQSLTRVAGLWGISEFVLSFILMAFATTLPEFGIGVSAAISGNSAIAVGNVLGTNIVNLSLVLGLVALISGGIRLDKHASSFFAYSRWFDVVLIFSPIVLLLDGTLSRSDGALLLALFVFHIWRLLSVRKIFFSPPHAYNQSQDHMVVRKVKKTFKETLYFCLFAALLLGASYAVVQSAGSLSGILGFPELLFGLFVVALGTSLPELVFGVRSAMVHKGEASLGNLLGAAVLNSTWVLGVAALINPIVISSVSLFLLSALFVVAVVVVAVLFVKSNNTISTKEGMFLIVLYILFIIFQIFAEFGLVL